MITDIIQIQLYLSDSLIAKYFWSIIRSRLTVGYLENIIAKISNEVPDLKSKRILYLQCLDDGEIILIDHMQHRCKKSPAKYALRMVEPIICHPFHNRRGSFRGKTLFLAQRIPRYSIDRKEVDGNDIRHWIKKCLLQDNDKLRIYSNLLDELDVHIQRINERIELLEKGGNEFLNHHEVEERREKSKRLDVEKRNAEQHYGVLIEERNRFVTQYVAQFEMSVELVETHAEYCSWCIKVLGLQKDYFDSLVVQKDSWTAVALKVNNDDLDGVEEYLNSPCWFDGASIVDLSGVILVSVEDGWGTFFSKEVSATRESVYHGLFSLGEKKGSGCCLSSFSIYIGSFNNHPSGEGTEVNSRGDILTGTFRVYKRNIYHSLLGSNPYERSYPNGSMKVQFSDGSFFDGVMVNGIVSGAGVYKSLRKSIEGQFNRGILEIGRVQCTNRFRVQAEFKNGLTQGQCSTVTPHHYFQCFYRDGEMHGYGTDFQASHCFLGNYLNGVVRSGHGVLLYSSELTCDKVWIGNEPRQGIMHFTLKLKSPQRDYSEEDLLSTVPIQKCSDKVDFCFQTLFQQLHSYIATYGKTEFNYGEAYTMFFDIEKIRNCRCYKPKRCHGDLLGDNQDDEHQSKNIFEQSCDQNSQFAVNAVRDKKGLDKVIQFELYKSLFQHTCFEPISTHIDY